MMNNKNETFDRARESQMRKVPEAAGCSVTSADIPLIIVSSSCFAAFILYGACNAALGAAVPALSHALSTSEAKVGFLFTFRGVGFLAGTLGIAGVISLPQVNELCSKQFLTCLATILMGLTTSGMAMTNSYAIMASLSVLQGFGFGLVDTLSNCLFPELWKKRIQPWMQALHLCFGIGAMTGPYLVGSLGYRSTYVLCGICSFIPLLLLQGYRLVCSCCTNRRNEDNKKSPRSSGTITARAEDCEGSNSTYSPLSTSMHDDDELDDEDLQFDIDSANEGRNSRTSVDNPVPRLLRKLIVMFYFIYAGMEMGYGGWISVYALHQNITFSESNAAYLASIYWGSLTVGRFLAIFTAILWSATSMLRMHLSFATLCTLLFVGSLVIATPPSADLPVDGTAATTSSSSFAYTYTSIVAGLFGFALSAIYALMMTIVMDYGFTMDATSTTQFMVGAISGEAGWPMMIGLGMGIFGYETLPWSVLAFSVILIFLYFAIDYVGTKEASTSSSTGSTLEPPSLMDDDTPEYYKISLNTGDDTDVETEADDDIEMTNFR